MMSGEILCVEIKQNYEALSIRGSEPTVSYYSNLSLLMDSLLSQLALHGWQTEGFNYTAVYRALKMKHVYVKRFTYKGTPFFRIRIYRMALNPKLNNFGLESCPEQT